MAPCDYMLASYEDAEGEEQELYAEVSLLEAPVDEDGNLLDELATYDELKEMILEEASEAGILPTQLGFYLDDVE